MLDVMKGIRILEVAEHTFVPAASALLADWADAAVVVSTRPATTLKTNPVRTLRRAIELPSSLGTSRRYFPQVSTPCSGTVISRCSQVKSP